MLSKILEKEFKTLSTQTNKTYQQIVDFYYICNKKIPTDEFVTEFEHNTYQTRMDNMILDYVRDFSHFDEDNSEMLKNYDPIIAKD